MKSYAQRSRQSSSVIYANRRYIKKVVSPDTSAYISPCVKSNQQLFSQITPHLQSQNARYGQKNLNNFTSTSKLGNQQLINYELFGISNSRNNIADHRKKGKSSFYKKIVDISSSELLFGQPKSTATKQISKMSSQQAQQSLQQIQNQVQELHYKMVEFQQKCKKMVAN